MSVHNSNLEALTGIDPTTGAASTVGAFGALDMSQAGFGTVGFDLGAIADAMGTGAIGDLSFTDYQDAAISGHLGHGPMGFDTYDESEALAEAMAADFADAGLDTAQGIADKAEAASQAAAAFEAELEAFGFDMTSMAAEPSGYGALSRADALSTSRAAAHKGFQQQDLIGYLGARISGIEKQRGDFGVMTELEARQSAAAQIVGAIESGAASTAAHAASFDPGGWNSTDPSPASLDIATATMNITGFNTVDYGRDKAVMDAVVANMTYARNPAALNAFAESSGISGGLSFGYGSEAPSIGSGGVSAPGYEAAAQLGGSLGTFGGYGVENIGDAEGMGHDAGADQTGGRSSADPESNEGSDSPDGPEGGDCFVQGTLVLMAEGSTKAIEKVVVGDLVAGKDGNANTVKATHIKKPDIPFLYGFNGHKPFVTAYHPFMTKEGWGCFEPEKFKEHRPTAYQEIANEQGGKDLIKIKNNCEILRSDNEWVLVEDIVVEGCDPNLTVYNLSVANDKTFVANNYIVHNKGDGDSKIICTAMNNMYGFGSYRNALWMKYQSSHMAAEEYELGYHKLFMPLVNKMPTNKYIKVFLERVAKNRTVNLRKEMRGQKTGIEYKLFKYAVRPLFFVVGWLVKKKILSKTEV
jgi:hypothetical protein